MNQDVPGEIPAIFLEVDHECGASTAGLIVTALLRMLYGGVKIAFVRVMTKSWAMLWILRPATQQEHPSSNLGPYRVHVKS